MTFHPAAPTNIRRLNLRTDLPSIADLIEICFAATLDPDGRDYLRHLRWAAVDSHFSSWMQNIASGLSAPLNGFVWEADGKIVGNLSLIPMLRGARLVIWIANVAVHPDYRRQGIARALTHAALDHLREQGVRSAWLQVRDDNPAAHQLYLAEGFVDRMRRTTWQSEMHAASVPMVDPRLKLTSPRHADWTRHERAMQRTYPPQVAWNLSFNTSRFSPSWWQRLRAWLQNEQRLSWAVDAHAGETAGFAAWEPSRAFCDNLWLGVEEAHEAAAVHCLAQHARGVTLYRGKPLQVNYPAGHAVNAFYDAGYLHHQTLIWMEAVLAK